MKVEIKKLDHFGRGITYINDKICFVEKALPGEIVKIKIVKETKRYLLGEVIDYYQLSDDRVDEICLYSDVCGGCNFGHLSLKEENSFKCNKVKEILKKFGDIEENLVKDTVCVNEYHYRNKITLHGENNTLGYYQKGTNKIVGIEKCLLANEKINAVVGLLKKMILSEDIRECVIRVSNSSDKIMVSLCGKIRDYSLLKDVVDTLIINDEILVGDTRIVSNIGDRKYYVSIDSFFQVNGKLTKLLYDEVLKVVQNVGAKKILDLYCGTGTIGLYVSDFIDELIGVDYSNSSIEDAIENAKLNNVSNAKFICDKVENVIEIFDNMDMVIVDPPRAGLDSKTIENIKRIGAKELIYISCDPVTLGRDLNELKSNYDVVFVKPFNMFPKTYHVENFVWLKKKI